MTVKDAYLIAKRDSSYPLLDCVDLGDKWGFYFGTDDDAGAPYLIIHKETGDLEYWTVPPMVNLYALHESSY